MFRLFLVALVAAVGFGRSNAQVPAALSHVPPDAAIFAHANVAKFWASAAGEQVRAAKIGEFDRIVAEFEAVTGLTPADVTSASVYFPDLRSPGGRDIPPFGVTLALTRPIDAGRLVAVAAVACRASNDQVSYTFAKNVLTVRFGADPRMKGKVPVKEEIVLDMTDALHPKLFAMLPAKSRDAATKPGALTPALAAAATKDFVVGLNYEMLPPELRTDTNNENGVRPFLPLFKSDLALVFGALTADKLAVEMRFRSGDAAVTRDCEKSLGAMRTLISTVLDAGIQKSGKSKDVGERLIVPLAESVKRSVETATIRIDGTDAVATLAIRADLPFGPALAAQFGKGVGGSRGDRMVSQTNLKQLGIAMHGYADTNGGSLPVAAVVGKKGKPLLSWRVLVLPYVEQDNLYRQFKLDEAWDSEHNLKVFKDNPMPPVFALPGVTKPGDKETYYRVFVGNGAAFEPLKVVIMPRGFPDGTSNTILIATAATSVPWTKPDELAFDPKGDMKKLLMMDEDGCNVTFADGSVRYLRSTMNGTNLNAMITRAGGEVIGDD
jgi:prepilin-type processing-associated H-X9-DG protein